MLLRQQHNRKGPNRIPFIAYGIGIVLVAILTSIVLFPRLQEHYEEGIKNVDIKFLDKSRFQENPGFQILLDGNVFYAIGDDNNGMYEVPPIQLRQGKYHVEIVSTQGVQLVDTMEIHDFPTMYDLTIAYHYSPVFEDYKRLLAQEVFEVEVLRQGIQPSDTTALRTAVNETLDKELGIGEGYTPISRSFSYTFEKKQRIILE